MPDYAPTLGYCTDLTATPIREPYTYSASTYDQYKFHKGRGIVCFVPRIVLTSKGRRDVRKGGKQGRGNVERLIKRDKKIESGSLKAPDVI